MFSKVVEEETAADNTRGLDTEFYSGLAFSCI